ncbi:MAG: glycosyltransferase, partial [candidate division NC10 bacterium]
MKRILFVATSSTVGGAEKTLYTLATLLNPSRYQVVGAVSLKSKGHYARLLERSGMSVDSLEVKKTVGLADMQKLAVIIHQKRPDLVHALMYQAMQLCRAVRRLGYAEYKLVTSPRVNFRTRNDWTMMLDGWLKKADDLLVAESEATQKYFVDKMGYAQDKVSRIYNGVDIAGWPISKFERERHRGELGIGPAEILVGSAGRLDAQKGHVFLLEAVAKIRATYPVKCIIFGEGPLKDELAKTAWSLGLANAVYFAGEQDDMPGWLSALDIYVQPSLWEGLPNALLEAMALGLPVVATRVDGIPE